MREASASRPLTISEQGLARLGAFPQNEPWQLDQATAKRAFDVIGALLLLLVLSPALLILAALVACSSPGPVLFKQERLGKRGEPFRFYKFRTMVDGNDPTDHRAYARALIRGEAQPVRGSFKLADDPRVTRVGAFLRRYSLDEFPQLFNVIQGHMSLVGPRPPLPYEAELYGPLEWQRLSVAPGITGLWQVSGRSRLTFDQMVDLDLTYIDRWSFWMDVLIVVRTPVAVLLGHGAR